jgi:hypothetical protein
MVFALFDNQSSNHHTFILIKRLFDHNIYTIYGINNKYIAYLFKPLPGTIKIPTPLTPGFALKLFFSPQLSPVASALFSR